LKIKQKELKAQLLATAREEIINELKTTAEEGQVILQYGLPIEFMKLVRVWNIHTANSPPLPPRV
jgi:hypothetical protein